MIGFVIALVLVALVAVSRLCSAIAAGKQEAADRTLLAFAVAVGALAIATTIGGAP